MNDQLIEDLEEVGVATLVKGLIDYSKAYGESMCNEFWELDTNDAGNNNGLTIYRGNDLCTFTTGAANQIILTRPVGSADFGAADACTAYFYNKQLVFFRSSTAAGDYTSETLTAVRIGGGPAYPTATLTISNVANHDVVRAFTTDGIEVTFLVNDAPSLIQGDATPDSILYTVLQQQIYLYLPRL